MMWQTNCLIAIWKSTPKSQGNLFRLAKKIEKFSSESKLMIVVATDFTMDQKYLHNITINTLLFQIKDGKSH